MYNVKRQITGCKNIEDVLIDFMFKRRFNASSGLSQIANTFNGNITVLSYSAGKRDRGKRHPREDGAKPLDSIEQGAKPPVRWQITGCKNIEDVLIDFMFKRRFNASSGLSQIANTFNGNITVLSYSAGKRDRGKRHPREEGAKPLDSIEQGAKPPVRWKVEKRYARKTFSKELKTCQRCYTRLCKL